VATAQHQLGDYRAELAALERGTRLVPGGATAYRTMRLRAFAGLHNAPPALALADTLLAESGDANRLTAVNAVQYGAREFAAHGDSTTSRLLGNKALDWYHAHTTATPTSARETALALAWFDHAGLDSAEAHFRQTASDTGTSAVARAGYLGVIAARRGDTTRARAVADSLAGQQRKWDLGLSIWWRAAIAAQLGQREAAVQLLREARGKGQSMIDWHAHTALAPLRGYPAFDALITPAK
jgi:hypothetical protein